MIVLTLIVLLIVYLILNVGLVIIRNYKAQQFYKKEAPFLPVLKNPSILSGHLFEVSYIDKNWKILTDLHNKYGRSFGHYMCEQPWIATTDIELIKLVFVDQGHIHYNKSIFGIPANGLNNSIFQTNDERWRRGRRAIAPTLTKRKIRSDEVSGDIDTILERFYKSLEFRLDEAKLKTGKRVIHLDVHDAFQRFSLAVIFLITYKRDDVIDFYAKEEIWGKTIEEGLRNVSHPIIKPIVSLNIMFPFLRPLISYLITFDKFDKLQVKVIDYIVKATDVNRQANERHKRAQKKLGLEAGKKELSFSKVMSQGEFKRRLVDSVIESFLEKNVNYDDLIGNLLFFLLAGFETIADTLTCLFWQLSQHPDIQEKLRIKMKEEGLDSEYGLWCILETVRWHPPVPLNGGRWLAEDVLHEGNIYPKGSYIVPSVHSIHHDETIWKDANQFKPERWEEKDSFHPAAFMGFGQGPRNCVGYQLATYEIKVVLKLMLEHYRVEKYEETTSEYNFSSPGLAYTLLDQPIKVKLIPL